MHDALHLKQLGGTTMTNRVGKDYSRVWHRVCVGWLGWSEDRFAQFVRGFDASLAAIDGGNWFYHEPPLYHILPLLITTAFQERLHKEVRKHRYGTPEWVYFRREMLMAIEGVPNLSGRFDWAAAKER